MIKSTKTWQTDKSFRVFGLIRKLNVTLPPPKGIGHNPSNLHLARLTVRHEPATKNPSYAK